MIKVVQGLANMCLLNLATMLRVQLTRYLCSSSNNFMILISIMVHFVTNIMRYTNGYRFMIQGIVLCCSLVSIIFRAVK